MRDFSDYQPFLTLSTIDLGRLANTKETLSEKTRVHFFARQGRREASSYLAGLGAKHREWRIPKELYPYFREALFDVLAKHHGDDWDESLMSQWAAAIDSATEQMVCGYDDPPQ